MAATSQNTDTGHSAENTSNSSYIPRGTVVAELKLYAPPGDGSKPFNYLDGTPIPEGLPKRKFGDADVPVTIHDV